MNLFQTGNFTLNSGATSRWKLECDALTDADWDGLAQLVLQAVGQFSSVEGVPRGGLKLASALSSLCVRSTTASAGTHLIVDDVLTTGGSMERFLKNRALQDPPLYHGRLVKGVAVFARGRCPEWVTPMFQMPESLWLKDQVKFHGET